MARILQERLQRMAEEVLQEFQCGFRKGRSFAGTSGFNLVGGGAGGKLPPQTLQLPPQKVWPITTSEVTTILGLTLFRCQC